MGEIAIWRKTFPRPRKTSDRADNFFCKLCHYYSSKVQKHRKDRENEKVPGQWFH